MTSIETIKAQSTLLLVLPFAWSAQAACKWKQTDPILSYGALFASVCRLSPFLRSKYRTCCIFFCQHDVISRWPCVRCVVSQQHDYIELVCTATYIEGSLVRVHTNTTAFPTQDSRSRCGFALHPTSPLHWLLMAWRLWIGDAPAHPIDERCIHCLYGNPRGWILELSSCCKPTSPSIWSCWELWFCKQLVWGHFCN